MEPSTPPRGSRLEGKLEQDYRVDEAQIGRQKDNLAFSTPRRKLQEAAPVTPLTIGKYKDNLVDRINTRDSVNRHDLVSPEPTPQQKSKTTKRQRTIYDDDDLKSDSQESLTEKINSKISSNFDTKSQNLFGKLIGEDVKYNKLAKQVPGTPSDKVITTELIEQWYGDKQDFESGSEDEEKFIVGNTIENPFQSPLILSDEELAQRKIDFQRQHPNASTTITYRNKFNNTVKERHLSPEERAMYKPRRLFEQELEEMRYDKDANK